MSVVKNAVPGMAFDVDQPLTGAQYAEFKSNGYEAVIRYIPRKASLVAGNLTAPEIAAILGAGLSLGVVQHVASPGWEPSAELGEIYGQYAAEYCGQIGLPKGITVWLDLEEVAPNEDVDGYCRAWFKAVEVAGYLGGLYVGYNCGLSDQQLYDLPTKSYWKAYNCDQSIPTRGWQITQHTQKTLNGIAYDPNTVAADNLGDLPIWLGPS